MATPNLVKPTNIKGQVTAASLGTSLTEVLANPPGSNQLYRVNCIRAANRDVTTRGVTVSFYRGGNHYYLYPPGAKVQAGSAMVIAVRDELTYLEEGDALHAQAEVIGQVDLLINWERIS
jgi:hypothetical protein